MCDTATDTKPPRYRAGPPARGCWNLTIFPALTSYKWHPALFPNPQTFLHLHMPQRDPNPDQNPSVPICVFCLVLEVGLIAELVRSNQSSAQTYCRGHCRFSPFCDTVAVYQNKWTEPQLSSCNPLCKLVFGKLRLRMKFQDVLSPPWVVVTINSLASIYGWRKQHIGIFFLFDLISLCQ